MVEQIAQMPISLLARLLQLMLVVGLFSLLYRNAKIFKLLNSTAKIFFLIVLAIYSGLLFWLYPGFLGIDEFHYMTMLEKNGPYYNTGAFYPLLIQAWYLLNGHIDNFAVINTILLLSLLLRCLEYFLEKPDRRMALGLFFIFLHPLTLSVLVYQTRDSTFTICLALLFIQALRIFKIQQARSEWIELLAYSFAASLIRQEGVLILVLTALFLWFFLAKELRKRIAIAIAVLGLGHFGFKLAEELSFEKNERLSAHYEMTTFMNPMGYIVYHKGLLNIAPEDLSVINKVFEPQKLIDFYSEKDVLPLWKGAVKHTFSMQDYADLKRIKNKLFVENFDLLFENRWKILLGQLNLQGQPYFIFNSNRPEDQWEGILRGRRLFSVEVDSSKMVERKEAFLGHLTSLVYDLPVLLKLPFMSLLPQLVVFLLSLFFGLKNIREKRWISVSGICALFSLFFMLRTAAFIALSPGDLLKYHISFWLVGTLMILVGATHRTSLRL